MNSSTRTGQFLSPNTTNFQMSDSGMIYKIVARFKQNNPRMINMAVKIGNSYVTEAATDKVDAEIQKLKVKKAQLEQKISSTQNPNADLQKQLSQIENELWQKDNDTYRKAHAQFSNGIDITA